MNLPADFVVSMIIVAAVAIAIGYWWGKSRLDKNDKG